MHTFMERQTSTSEISSVGMFPTTNILPPITSACTEDHLHSIFKGNDSCAVDSSNISHWGTQYGIRRNDPGFQESCQSYLEHTKEDGLFQDLKNSHGYSLLIQGDLWAHTGETTWQFLRIFPWALAHSWAGPYPSIGNRVHFHRTRISAEGDPKFELFPPWLLIVVVALDALRMWLQMLSYTGSLYGSFCKMLWRPDSAVIFKHFGPENVSCLSLELEGFPEPADYKCFIFLPSFWDSCFNCLITTWTLVHPNWFHPNSKLLTLDSLPNSWDSSQASSLAGMDRFNLLVFMLFTLSSAKMERFSHGTSSSET